MVDLGSAAHQSDARRLQLRLAPFEQEVQAWHLRTVLSRQRGERGERVSKHETISR